MITILDIGCRYGIFPKFRNNYQLIKYIGVDADKSEINRLKKKYKNQPNLKFKFAFLGNKNKKILFNFYSHKGYSSSKKINKNSLWFGQIRPNEYKIKKKEQIKCFKSGNWISKNIKGKIILKLDIEGGELDFLKGLDLVNFRNIEAIIAETHFDRPFLTNSNFSTISNFLIKRGYWISTMDLENEKLSKYSIVNDYIPTSSTTVFMKRKYQPKFFDINDAENICVTFYLLGMYALLIDYCKLIGFKKLKKIKIFDRLKFVIGHRFNYLKKDPLFEYEDLNKEFMKMFNENLPSMSNFNESLFYNP